MTGLVVWFTGLPASGKTTLAREVEQALLPDLQAVVLDSDEVRATLSPAPGYDDAGRDAFYDTLSSLAAQLAQAGQVVLVAATANLQRYRARARERAPAWLEVYVDTPLEVCRARDSKGLYADATAAARLPGVGAPFEPPLAPEVTVRPGEADAARVVAARIRERRRTPLV